MSAIALSGRRIDAPNSAHERFPLRNVEIVTKKLEDLFALVNATTLVSSAACGADLIALDIAHRAGIKIEIVLPFKPEAFYKTSVIDRPGNWGPVFQRLIAAVPPERIVIVGPADNEELAYKNAAEEIVFRAVRSADAPPAIAVIVWEGSPRGEGDITAYFSDFARDNGARVEIVSTLA